MIVPERRDLLERCYSLIHEVDGDVVELGVKWGTSLAVLAGLSGHRHVWGFDSWEDGQPLGEHDVVEAAHFPYNPGIILEKVRREGGSPGRVGLVKGWIADTLPGWVSRHGPVSFIHFDVGIYQSYMDGFVNLWPILSPGGVMVFDEYQRTEDFPGAKKAVDEFLADKYATLVEDYRWYAVKNV